MKDYLIPGMLVKLRNGEVAIIAYETNGITTRKILSWNDCSGRSVEIKDYNDKLEYPSAIYLSIDIIYSLNGFTSPFDMDEKKRAILWERNANNKFSYSERALALHLKDLVNYLCPSKNIYLIKKLNNIISIISDEGVEVNFPSKTTFINIPINKQVNVDDIIHGEILQQK